MGDNTNVLEECCEVVSEQEAPQRRPNEVDWSAQVMAEFQSAADQFNTQKLFPARCLPLGPNTGGPSSFRFFGGDGVVSAAYALVEPSLCALSEALPLACGDADDAESAAFWGQIVWDGPSCSATFGSPNGVFAQPVVEQDIDQSGGQSEVARLS